MHTVKNENQHNIHEDRNTSIVHWRSKT